MIFKNTKVQVGNILPRDVQVYTGLKQEELLSPIIFIMVQEKVARMVNVSPDDGAKLIGTSFSVCIRYIAIREWHRDSEGLMCNTYRNS